MLPYFLDVVGFEAREARGEAGQRAFDRFGVAFEGGFAPADAVIAVGDFDEEPLGYSAVRGLWEGKWLETGKGRLTRGMTRKYSMDLMGAMLVLFSKWWDG